MKLIRMSKASATIVASIVLTAIASNAMAYSKSTCLGEEIKWGSNSKALEANSVSFPSGTWFNGVSDGVAKFNLNPSRFRYSVFSSGGGVSRGNGQSEIWGSTSADVLQGFPAIAYSWWTCYWFFGDHVHMDEVDIAFDYGSPWKWTTSSDKKRLLRYSDTATDLRPLQTTLAHEVGHGAHLNHVNTEYNVMGTDFEHIHVNGTTARAYAGEDVADGMVDLYGARSGAWEDLGVVHWKYSGASGEYSDHTKTIIRNSAGGLLPTFTIVDPGTTRETAYRVSPGQTIRVEFTYENNGKTRQPSAQIGFYVSSNHLVTTWDTRIGGVTLDLGRNNVYTRTDTVTLPSSLEVDRIYWVGAIIDENDSLSEAVEWNNATYIPIRVQ